MYVFPRGSQAKALLAQRFTAVTVSDSPTQKTTQPKALSKPRPKQTKAKAEPPPKKRKKWKEEFTTSPSDSSPEAVSEDDGETCDSCVPKCVHINDGKSMLLIEAIVLKKNYYSLMTSSG